MALEDALLAILVCPADKGALLYFRDDEVLYNPRLHRLYRIEDGIPVMMTGKSVHVPDAEHDQLMARAEQATVTAGAEDLSPAAGKRSAPAGG